MSTAPSKSRTGSRPSSSSGPRALPSAGFVSTELAPLATRSITNNLSGSAAPVAIPRSRQVSFDGISGRLSEADVMRQAFGGRLSKTSESPLSEHPFGKPRYLEATPAVPAPQRSQPQAVPARNPARRGRVNSDSSGRSRPSEAASPPTPMTIRSSRAVGGSTSDLDLGRRMSTASSPASSIGSGHSYHGSSRGCSIAGDDSSDAGAEEFGASTRPAPPIPSSDHGVRRESVLLPAAAPNSPVFAGPSPFSAVEASPAAPVVEPPAPVSPRTQAEGSQLDVPTSPRSRASSFTSDARTSYSGSSQFAPVGMLLSPFSSPSLTKPRVRSASDAGSPTLSRRGSEWPANGPPRVWEYRSSNFDVGVTPTLKPHVDLRPGTTLMVWVQFRGDSTLDETDFKRIEVVLTGTCVTEVDSSTPHRFLELRKVMHPPEKADASAEELKTAGVLPRMGWKVPVVIPSTTTCTCAGHAGYPIPPSFVGLSTAECVVRYQLRVKGVRKSKLFAIDDRCQITLEVAREETGVPATPVDSPSLQVHGKWHVALDGPRKFGDAEDYLVSTQLAYAIETATTPLPVVTAYKPIGRLLAINYRLLIVGANSETLHKLVTGLRVTIHRRAAFGPHVLEKPLQHRGPGKDDRQLSAEPVSVVWPAERDDVPWPRITLHDDGATLRCDLQGQLFVEERLLRMIRCCNAEVWYTIQARSWPAGEVPSSQGRSGGAVRGTREEQDMGKAKWSSQSVFEAPLTLLYPDDGAEAKSQASGSSGGLQLPPTMTSPPNSPPRPQRHFSARPIPRLPAPSVPLPEIPSTHRSRASIGSMVLPGPALPLNPDAAVEVPSTHPPPVHQNAPAPAAYPKRYLKAFRRPRTATSEVSVESGALGPWADKKDNSRGSSLDCSSCEEPTSSGDNKLPKQPPREPAQSSKRTSFLKLRGRPSSSSGRKSTSSNSKRPSTATGVSGYAPIRTR